MGLFFCHYRRWTADEARILRVSVSSFLDHLSLVMETMDAFGPPVSQWHLNEKRFGCRKSTRCHKLGIEDVWGKYHLRCGQDGLQGLVMNMLLFSWFVSLSRKAGLGSKVNSKTDFKKEAECIFHLNRFINGELFRKQYQEMI